MEAEFNLLDEKWIRVLLPDYSVKEVSLTDALVNAHRYRDLAGEMKAQDVAVLRLLLAVLHTVFSRVNTEGEPDPLEDELDAIGRWAELWERKQFPEKPIREYLEQYRDRFYLFHPTFPFYQVPEAINGAVFTAAKLNGALSESKRKARLFPERTGKLHDTLTYSEAARWLLFINSYDDTSAKKFGGKLPTIGWLGKIGIVTAAGNNLFETLMFNLTLLKDGEKVWGENCPVWEGEGHKEVMREVPQPDNQAELLTLQSRRIILEREEGLVTGYYAFGGDYFQEENAFSEQMTIWQEKKNDKNVLMPKRHKADEQMWRDFNALVANGKNRKIPGLVSWLSLLREREILPKETMIQLRSSAVRYDISQSSAITDEFGDSLSFVSELLTEKGRLWQELVIQEVERCDKRGKQIGFLAKDLVCAAGGSKEEEKSQYEKAVGRYFYQLDLPFRKWLSSLEPWQRAETRYEKREEWNSIAGGTARKLGREMAEEAGPKAFIGRKDENSGKYYSASSALNWFNYQMAKLAKEG